MSHRQAYAVLSLILVLSTIITTTPISASELAGKGVIGSVSVVGAVELRGVPLAQEATLFLGDQLRVADKGYAKVTLVNGQKLEIGSNSDATLSGRAGKIELSLRSGNASFTSPGATPLKVTVGTYEITGNHKVSGNVAVGNDTLAVHILTGSVLVRNQKTKESYEVSNGQERLISLNASAGAPIQVASNVPTPIPPIPGSDSGDPGSTTNTTKEHGGILGLPGGLLGSIGILGGAGAAAAAVAITSGGQSPAVQGGAGQSATDTAQQAINAATQVANTAAAANTAIANAQNVPAGTRATLNAQAQSIQSQAQASAQQITNLLQQLQQSMSAQTQTVPEGKAVLSPRAQNQAQINAIIGNLNSEISRLNGLINQLHDLLNRASSVGVPGLPAMPPLQAIPQATSASPSAPQVK
jgi:hypothetical protein